MSLCYTETKTCMINIINSFFSSLLALKYNYGQSPVGGFV